MKQESESTAFWDQYDIPHAIGLAQNSRISELRRGSTGTGRTRNTAVHLAVLEDIEEGRLSRDENEFLCHGEGKNPTYVGEVKTGSEPVTCSNCLSLMERWKKG